MRVGKALTMVPRTMKKGPMSVSLRETSHAVDVVPMLAPSMTPRLERKVSIPEIDQGNSERHYRAAGLDNRSGRGAKQRASLRTAG